MLSPASAGPAGARAMQPVCGDLEMTQPIDAPFPVHTEASAPLASKPALERLRAAVGMVPHLAAAMAESTVLIEAFVGLRETFRRGTFSPVEREALSLANAVENGCRYCTAIHATFALKESRRR